MHIKLEKFVPVNKCVKIPQDDDAVRERFRRDTNMRNSAIQQDFAHFTKGLTSQVIVRNARNTAWLKYLKNSNF